MQEPQIGINALVAWTLWVLSTLLVLGGTIALALDDHHDVALAFYAHAMLVIGMAATATLKCYILENRRAMTDAVELNDDVVERLRRLR